MPNHWLLIPADGEDFESGALHACELILKHNPPGPHSKIEAVVVQPLRSGGRFLIEIALIKPVECIRGRRWRNPYPAKYDAGVWRI